MSEDREATLRIRYKKYGEAAREIVMDERAAQALPYIRLAAIGPTALAQAATWQNRRVDWDWEALHRKWTRRPRHIALAIWVDPTLCALALGRIGDGRVVARIDRLERSPLVTDDQIASVAEVAVRYLEVVGSLAGCREAVLWSPAPQLIDYYKRLGYESEITKRGKIIGLKRLLTEMKGGEK